MKLWEKSIPASQEVENFTVGKDRELDMHLASHDVIGSLAHIKMLHSIGLLNDTEHAELRTGLKNIYKNIRDNQFSLEDGVEDVHSQVEKLLTQQLGDTGKKIHSARSRNDQVLLDLKLFMRSEIEALVKACRRLFDALISQSEKYKDVLMPGYTHLQLAMPSSFGLWFGAYAESLADDMITLHAAWEIVNKNPLGSGAGFGSSFPIDRKLTTDLLGFEKMNYNVVYAQMGRGKTERIVAQALANFGATLARFSMDACIYLNQNMGFISLPTELTTGSSIMPHKKNPDVFEIIRGYGNRLQSLPNEIAMMATNLPSGYHRDFQLLKEHMIPAFGTLANCFQMATMMVDKMEVKQDILDDKKYKYLFTVEEMNKLVLKGMPLRDAYKEIGAQVEAGTFEYDKKLMHTHDGSMGNLRNDAITDQMNEVIGRFTFVKVNKAIQKLLE
ncbi:argininosuccinate lyase [soil metagenome]